jgi:lambda family phage portal protein
MNKATFQWDAANSRWISKAASPIVRIPKRAFAAAKNSRLTSGWLQGPVTLDSDLLAGLTSLRGRSREEAENNPYYDGFIRETCNNVVGPFGFQLVGEIRNRNGVRDKKANDLVEYHWQQWSKPKGFPSSSGKYSFRQVCNLWLSSLIKDGEFFAIEYPGYRRSPYRYTIRFIDPDLVPVSLNTVATNGNRIVMGIELDEFDAPIAYYVQTREDSGPFRVARFPELGTRKFYRVPAESMIHNYLPKAVIQTRGFPWVSSALLRFFHLNQYQEAELIAARAGASKMGWITEGEIGRPYLGDTDDEDLEDLEDESVLYEEFEPGVIGRLKPGQAFTAFDPTHPNQAFGDFTKSMLRGAAAGLGTSYNSLASDLEGVNYSSLREGKLREINTYMGLQEFCREHFLERVFDGWLTASMYAGLIAPAGGNPIPLEKKEKLSQVMFSPYRWEWVDPQKEGAAIDKAISNRTMSRSEAIRKRGKNPEDVFKEIADEDELLASLGISVAESQTAGSGDGGSADDSQTGQAGDEDNADE